MIARQRWCELSSFAREKWMMTGVDLKSKVCAFNSAEWQTSETLHLFKHKLFYSRSRYASSLFFLTLVFLFPRSSLIFKFFFFLIYVFLASSLSWLTPQSLFQRWRGVSMLQGTSTNTVTATRYMHTHTDLETQDYVIMVPLTPKSVEPQCTQLLCETHRQYRHTVWSLWSLCAELQKASATQRVP